MRIVDCDVHVREVPSELVEYCEMPWRKAVEMIPAGTDEFDGNTVGSYALPGLAPGHGDGREPLWPGGQNRQQSVTSPTRCRQDLDDFGIESAILFPDYLLTINLLADIDYVFTVQKS